MSVDTDVRAAAGGDRAAFARLYDRFARAVLLDLAARMRRREDAEDALQTTFVKAWRALPGLLRADRFVPWLFRIARNTARDHGRIHRDRPRLVRLEDAPEPASAAPRLAEETGRVRELVARLKPATRAIVLLRAVEGWSAEEVARAHRLHLATVRRRYARALRGLRAALERENERESA